MKSRTNAQQELMRQQMIEEERNNPFQISQSPKASPTSFKVTKPNRDVSAKQCFTQTKPLTLDSLINKRQRSSSYSFTSDSYQTKQELFSPSTKSPMDLAFSNLGNDDALDWNQIEPSLTSTSEMSQELLEQMTRGGRGTHEIIHESYMETGTEENDSFQDDQSVSSMKPSMSCPANIAHPTLLIGQGHSMLVNQPHKSTQKPLSGAVAVTALGDEHKLQWMRDRNKKDCHNRIERKRRDYINNQIQDLGQLLPEKLFLSTESKRNKGGILKNSVIYIQQLRQVLESVHHLQKEAQISENIITTFYKRLQHLETLLTQNGIQFDQPVNEKVTLQQWFDIHQHNSELLQTVNSIQSSWSSDHELNDKSSCYGTGYDDTTIKSEDVSAENVFNSVPMGRIAQSSNSGAGGSSSGTQSVTNYHSPQNTTSITSSTNHSNTNNNNNSSSNIIRSRNTPTSNVNIVSVNSPQQRHSQIYGSSQPFSKTNSRLYEQSSAKSCVTDSPVLSSILIGAGAKPSNEYPVTNRQQLFAGLSNSVPDGTRAAYLPQHPNVDNNSGERYYLIPITKTNKGIQFVTNDMSSNRGIIKIDAGVSHLDEPPLSRVRPSITSRSPHITILNSYSLSNDNDETQQRSIDISPNHNDNNDDSLMGEFDFDDIPME